MLLKYLPLIWSGLWRKKTRTLFTGLSLIAAFLLLGLLQAVNSLFSGGADFLGANRLITQARVSFTQPLPMRLLPQIEAVPGVQSVSHSQFFGGVYQDARNFFPQFAVNPQRMLDTYPEWVLSPAQRRAFISTPNGAIAGRVLAERFGWKVGDRIPLTSFIWTLADGSRAWEWELVGIFDGRDEQWSERASLMYLNYQYFDEARSGGQGLAGVFAVRIKDALQAERIASTIDAKFVNSRDETKTQSEQEFQIGFLRQLGDIGFIVNAILGAVFFTILMLTGNTMAQAVRERTPELAVLKCLGFTDRTVLALVLAEALLLCLLGGLAGMVLASFATAALPADFPPVRTDVRVWIIALSSMVLLAVAVGLPPALHAMRIKIVDALAGR